MTPTQQLMLFTFGLLIVYLILAPEMQRRGLL